MLFRYLGFITSFGNIAVIYGLVSKETILDFWSPHWIIGLYSVLFLSLTSTVLFYLNNKDEGINVLKVYGGIYGVLSLMIYGYWGIKNLINPISFNEFKGSFILFMSLSIISFFSIRSYIQQYEGAKLLLWISSILSILTIGITFATIYKYIFLEAPFDLDELFFEILIIGLGSVLFLVSYNYAARNA